VAPESDDELDGLDDEPDEPHDAEPDDRERALSARARRKQTNRSMDRLDERERRFSFAAAGLAVLFGIVVYVSETTNSHFRLAKNQLTPQTTLVFGLIAGALLLVTTLLGRRAPVGFVALFTFLAFGTQYLLGVPFLVLAVWLLYRSFKIQREASAAARAERADQQRGRAGSTGRSSGRCSGCRRRCSGCGRCSGRSAEGSSEAVIATPGVCDMNRAGSPAVLAGPPGFSVCAERAWASTGEAPR